MAVYLDARVDVRVTADAGRSPGASGGLPRPITVPVPGAVAAFSLNSFFAEAKVDSEELIIFGKNPGSAHIVVVTHEDTKTFEVRILPNPPSIHPVLCRRCRLRPHARTGVMRRASHPTLRNRRTYWIRRAGRAIGW